jgi:hypothetical protein
VKEGCSFGKLCSNRLCLRFRIRENSGILLRTFFLEAKHLLSPGRRDIGRESVGSRSRVEGLATGNYISGKRGLV